MLVKFKNLVSGGKGRSSVASARGSGAIDKKAVMVGVLLILSVMVVLLMFSLESSQTDKNKIYSSIAFEQQVISQQIAVNALEAAAGRAKSFERLAANQKRFLGTLAKYNNGDSSLKLPPLPLDFTTEYSSLKAVWNDYDRHISTVVAAKKSIATVNEYVTQINESLPELLSVMQATQRAAWELTSEISMEMAAAIYSSPTMRWKTTHCIAPWAMPASWTLRCRPS